VSGRVFQQTFFGKQSSVVAKSFHFVVLIMSVKYFEITTTFGGRSRMKGKILIFCFNTKQ